MFSSHGFSPTFRSPRLPDDLTWLDGNGCGYGHSEYCASADLLWGEGGNVARAADRPKERCLRYGDDGHFSHEAAKHRLRKFSQQGRCKRTPVS